MKLHSRHFSLYHGEKDVTKWMVDGPSERNRLSNWPVEYAVADTKEAVLEAFAKVHAKMKSKGDEVDVGPKVRFDIFSDRYTKAVFIGKKNGKRVVKMKTFPDVKAAREYLKSNQAELEAQYDRMKQLPAVRGEDNAPRVGSDYRNGLDVTPELFSEMFGFRGVQFGNYVEVRRRQQDLNDAFDALMDMAGILNIPPRAISLNGELGLAFGARGTGGPDPAMAHYEPAQVVINLTKSKGAGSLGHEWWHSLDNYLSRARGAPGGMLSEAAYERGGGVRPEIVEAFANINKAINRTQLRQRSEKLDELRTKDYWSTKLEMTARAFESYLIAKLSEGGVRSDYLANVVSEKAYALEESYPYPTAGEIPEIRAAYDNLFEVIETRQDDNGNVALYRLSPDEPMLRINPGSAAGIPVFNAKAIAQQVQEATGLRATVVDTEFALPPVVLEQVLRDGVVGRVAGLYYQGQAYLVASNLASPKHAQEVLLHEVVGHQGVRAVLGNRTGKVMQQIYADIPEQQRQELEQRYAGQLENLGEQERRITVAEEYVAHLAETNPQHSLIRRLVAMVRAALRQMFGATGALRWTNDDIVALLADARRMVGGDQPAMDLAPQPAAAVNYRQKPAAPQPAALPQVEEVNDADALDELTGQEGAQAFARSLYRARGTDSPFFQRWFEGSRMVDKGGRPVAFYHRSFGEKDRFDDSRLGGKTGTGTAALGHFLARQDVGNIERYGPVVERFFVRMRNPKVISQQQFEAMGDWTDAQLKAYRKTMMDRGHDGLYIQGLGWPVVFEGKNIKAVRNSGTFDDTDSVRYSLGELVDGIRRVISSAKGRGHAPEKATLGQVPQWLRQAAMQAGLDLTGFKHLIDGSAVRHVLKNHGDAKVEQRRGQLPVTEADFERLPELVAAPDRVVFGTKNRLGRDQIAYAKRMDDGSILYMEEVRTGRKELAAVSLRKYPATMNVDSIVSTLDPNAQGDGGHGPIVVHNPAASNAGVRYSLAQDANDLFNRYGRRPADPNDPFAEENRRLREQDKTLWSRAKQQFRRQFAPGGLLPEAVFSEKIRRDSEFQAVEFDVRHLAGGLEQAVKADFGVPIDQLQEAQLKPLAEALAEALAGRVDPALPQRTREAVVAMRQYIDSLSGEYIGILQQQVEQNLKDADPALVETITRNMGSYVHRSYRAFDDAKWFEKVPTETLNAARRYLANQYQGQGASAAEANRLADVKVNELLKTGTAYSSMESMIAEGKLGAKDLSVLIRRKEIAPEIRALLGEYTDPRVNFAKSATKMGRLIWNQRFLDRVRAQGMGAFLFEESDRPAGATEQLAGEQSDTYAPMNGLWTFPEVAQAFRDSMGKEQMSDLYRTVVRLNGMVKYGKTVLSPTTAMRNWQSAMFFSLANGHFDLSQMKKSLAAFREQVSQNATGEDLAYLRKLKQLGVVYDTPYAGEMARFIEDAKLEELLEGKTGTGLKWLRQINQVAQGFYSFGDDFWKIIGFENEKAGLQKAGFSEAEAERMAAERIRNTYPTYSMVGRGIDWLRRFPLAGTFVSFPSEIVRTTVNMLRQTAADLKSTNPGLQALGRRRAVGMAMVSAGFYALSAMTAAAFGVDDEEEEALRDLAPEWQKNSTFLYAGRDADGKLRYFDMSFLDPYGYWKRPLTAMMRDQPWEKAAASGMGDMLAPFLGADIAAGALFEVMANKKGSGGPVYQENGDPVDQTLDIANHLRKALQPGFVSNAERLVLAGQGVRREGSGQAYDLRDEVVSLLGWRASTTDARTALHYRAYEFGDALAESRQVLTRELRSQNKVGEEDIRDAHETAERQYQQAFREMNRLVQAAQTAGMSRPQVMQTLRMSGVSSADVAQLMRGEAPRFRLGPTAMGRAVQQARLVGGQAHAEEVAGRYRLAMSL